MGSWASLSPGAGEGHYLDQLFRVWLWELSQEETAGPAEWHTSGSPWGRPRRPSKMERLHLRSRLKKVPLQRFTEFSASGRKEIEAP